MAAAESIALQGRLDALVGEWQGETRTWFRPGEPVREAPVTGRMRKVADGTGVLHEYQSSLDGEPFTGVVLYAVDVAKERVTAAWVDGFHMSTAMMVSEGPLRPDVVMDVLGHWEAGGETWGWRTVVRQVSPDHLEQVAFLITPSGEEHRATETHYHRRV